MPKLPLYNYLKNDWAPRINVQHGSGIITGGCRSWLPPPALASPLVLQGLGLDPLIQKVATDVAVHDEVEDLYRPSEYDIVGQRHGQALLHLYLPHSLMSSIADEYSRIGRPASVDKLSALAFRDETVTMQMGRLMAAHRAGEPYLYAAAPHTGSPPISFPNRRNGNTSPRILVLQLTLLTGDWHGSSNS